MPDTATFWWLETTTGRVLPLMDKRYQGKIPTTWSRCGGQGKSTSAPRHWFIWSAQCNNCLSPRVSLTLALQLKLWHHRILKCERNLLAPALQLTLWDDLILCEQNMAVTILVTPIKGFYAEAPLFKQWDLYNALLISISSLACAESCVVVHGLCSLQQ